jgi:type VI secretion system protein ImpK
MTPVDLCEPLFQYVCRVNRSARKGVVYAKEQVRAEVKALMDEIRDRVAGDPPLAAQFDPARGKLLTVLKCYVDFTIRNSSLSFASKWQDLSQEDGVTSGDQKFWELLDETLLDQTAGASDRLPVFYTCIGLGFTGWHMGQPEYLQRRMLEISARLRGKLDVNPAGRVCPEAYEHTNTADLIRPPGTPLAKIGITVLGMVLVVFVANAVLYIQAKRDLSNSVKELKDEKANPEATSAAWPRAGGRATVAAAGAD